MKKVILSMSAALLLASCGSTTVEEKDERIVTCETVASETQAKLTKANTNPEIELEYLGVETILADVSRCFLKVKVSNPSDESKADVYSLFDVVREKTIENFETPEAHDTAIEQIRENQSKIKVKVK